MPTEASLKQFYGKVNDFKDQILRLLRRLSGKKLVDREGHPLDIEEEIASLNKGYDKLMMAKAINELEPIKAMYENGIMPMIEPILLRDEVFFLDGLDGRVPGAYEEILQDLPSNITDFLFLHQVRIIWSHLDLIEDKAVKAILWAHIQIFCLLAEKVLSQIDPYYYNIFATTKQQLIDSGRLS